MDKNFDFVGAVLKISHRTNLSAAERVAENDDWQRLQILLDAATVVLWREVDTEDIVSSVNQWRLYRAGADRPTIMPPWNSRREVLDGADKIVCRAALKVADRAVLWMSSAELLVAADGEAAIPNRMPMASERELEAIVSLLPFVAVVLPSAAKAALYHRRD